MACQQVQACSCRRSGAAKARLASIKGVKILRSEVESIICKQGNRDLEGNSDVTFEISPQSSCHKKQDEPFAFGIITHQFLGGAITGSRQVTL